MSPITSSFVLLMLGTSGVVLSAVTFPQPLGFWPMDRNHDRADLGPHRRDITATNVLRSEDCPHAYLGQGSFEFQGTSTSYGIISNSNGVLSASQSFTFMAWLKNLNSAGPMFTFYPDSSSCSHGLLFWHLGVGQFHYNSNYGGFNGYTSGNTVPLNEWTAVAVTYDYTSGVYSMFINGAEHRTVRKTGANQTPVAGSSYTVIRMGACPSDARYLQARMFCMQWYDQALSSEELNMAWARCKRNELSLHDWPLPLGVWPLTEKHGNADISGNAVHATFNEITFASGPNGEAGGAAQFSYDKMSYIDLPNADGKLNYYGSHTIAFWVYVENNAADSAPIFNQAAQTDPNAADGTWLRHIWLQEGGTIALSRYSSMGSGSPDPNLVNGRWNWLVFSADQRLGVEKVYENGVEVASYDIAAYPEPLAVDRSFRIGMRFYVQCKQRCSRVNRPTVTAVYGYVGSYSFQCFLQRRAFCAIKDFCPTPPTQGIHVYDFQADSSYRFHGKLACLQLYDCPISKENLHLIQSRCSDPTGDISENLFSSFPFTHDLADEFNSSRIFTSNAGGHFNWTAAQNSRRGLKFGKSINNSARLTLTNAEYNSVLNERMRYTSTVSFWMRHDEMTEFSQFTYFRIINTNSAHGFAQDWYLLHKPCGSVNICLHARVNSAFPNGPSWSTSYDRPIVEYLGHWHHFVVTSDTSIGISSLFIDGELVQTIFVKPGHIEIEDDSVVDLTQWSGRIQSYNCLQFRAGRITQGQLIHIRDACYGNNAKDILRPIAFWSMDRFYGYEDMAEIAEVILDLAITDLELADGLGGQPKTASLFNGQTSFAIAAYDSSLQFRVAFSLLVWIYPTAFDQVGPIISTTNLFVNETAKYSLYVSGDGSGDLNFFIQWNTNDATTLTAPAALELNSWSSIAVVLDDRYNALELYVNGIRYARDVNADLVTVTNLYNTNIVLGAAVLPDVGEQFYEGRVACAQIYSYGLQGDQLKRAQTFCKYKSLTSTNFKKGEVEPGVSPGSGSAIHSSNVRNTLSCISLCVKHNYCMSASFYTDNGQCDLHNVTVKSSEDDLSIYENTGASDYFEIHHPLNRDTV